MSHTSNRPKYHHIVWRAAEHARPIENIEQQLKELKQLAVLPAALVVSSDVFIALVADFIEWEPPHNIELVNEGYLGRYKGFPVYSDAHFHPAIKRLPLETLKLVSLEDSEVI